MAEDPAGQGSDPTRLGDQGCVVDPATLVLKLPSPLTHLLAVDDPGNLLLVQGKA